MTPAMGYTEMKESGIEWVGRIPAHWMLRRIKTLATEKDSLFIDGDWINAQDISESGIRYLTTGNIGQGIFKEQGKGYISEETFERLRCLEVHAGDLVVSRLNTPVGRACIIPAKYRHCVVAVDNVVLRPDKVYHKRFLMYCMSSDRYAEFTQLLARGTTMQRISRTQLGNICLPIPPYEEQLAIAAYLDTQCAKIDEIIAEAKASIEDYKQWKASIIYEAVTKGLGPNTEMKNSGIEWIGEIPKGWNTIRLKYAVAIKKDIAGGLGYTVLSVTQQGIKPKNMHDKGQFALDYSKYQLVTPGDFIMNHMDLLTGWIDISSSAGVTSPDYRVFTINFPDRFNPQYYRYVFQNCYRHKIFYGLGQGVSGLGRWRLPASMFLNFCVPVPPKDRQKEIAMFLDEVCAQIDGLIVEKESLVTDLESYKKSLIYEVVTGKRRVC